jgi:acetylornithine/N-succinyldiaminopimelate aminotransferase
MTDHLMSTYSRLPIEFERGEGAYLWSSQGEQYLDALSGIAVCGLGHAHPAVTRAICEQAGKLVHCSNLYGIPLQEKLATALTRLSGMERCFFCNSGAEANEAAIKLARRYGHDRDIDAPAVIVTENSFHGRTMATLTATGNRRVQAGFEPLLPGFVRVPYNDLAAIRKVAETTPGIVAVLVEPIQGEGGIRIPDRHYLSGIRELCDEQQWLMMLDEVQTGMGRTGRWFACQHEELIPDVITIAKSLGNGMPIGACLAHGAAAGVLQPGSHGSTFGGNPLASHTALAVIETIEKGNYLQRAAELGASLLDEFRSRLSGVSGIIDIRGQGLMLGIELDRPCPELVSMALEKNILINVTAGKVVRLLPPLVISDEQASEIALIVSDLILEFLQAS